MKQYQVIYADKGTEYIFAYGYTRHGKTVVFDLGRGSRRTVNGVKAVFEL